MVLVATVVSALGAGCGGPGQPAPSSSGAPGAPATGAAAPATAAHRADGAPSSLDVDGDGVIGAYTDSLLIFRYTSGMRGETLIQGAVGKDCKRCTAEQIEAYIGSL